MMKTVKLSGRNPKLMDNPHVFDQVSQFTDLLLVDDCDRYLNLGLFYDNITSDMTVNPKNNRSFTIGFDESPKLAFTTNYVPSDFDPSSELARYIWCSQTGITSVLRTMTTTRLAPFATTSAKRSMPSTTPTTSGMQTLTSGYSAAGSISR